MYTFRGHTGPVLCLAMSATGEQCFSGGLDGSLQCWNIPGSNIDPYDSYGESRATNCPINLLTTPLFSSDPSVLSNSLVGHTDAIWGLSLHSHKLHLLSCSADGSVRLWNPQSKTPLLSVFTSDAGNGLHGTISGVRQSQSIACSDGVPTSVDFVRDDPNKMVTSYTSAAGIIFDVETGQQVIRLDTDKVTKRRTQAGRLFHDRQSQPLYLRRGSTTRCSVGKSTASSRIRRFRSRSPRTRTGTSASTTTTRESWRTPWSPTSTPSLA